MAKRKILFSPPDVGEREIREVIEAIQSGWITTGPRTKLLEKRLAAYIDTGKTDIDCTLFENAEKYNERVACLGSGTAAEELNLRLLGIRQGDEVIVPAYTYTATASAAIHCGATVVFADILKDGDPVTHLPEIDYQKMEDAITARTKAIIPVDLGGIVCDYQRIYDILKRKKKLFSPLKSDGTPLNDFSSRIQQAIGRVAVVADCAHGLGAGRLIDNRKINCGNIADFTSFSFHAVKNFTTAEGGAATWRSLPGIDNAEIYRMYQLLSLHGQSQDALSKSKNGSWEYDVIGPWYKCNMTDITAAIGLKQLDRFQDLLNRRMEIIRQYDKACDEIGVSHLVHRSDNVFGSGHLYIIRIPQTDESVRNEVILRLAERGVPTNVHYKPLPMMSAYREYGWDIKDFPHSFDYYQNALTLPLHTGLTDEDVHYICESLSEVMKEIRK